MNADEKAKADAEWDALPGTSPNGWSFRSNEQLAARSSGWDMAVEMLTAHPNTKHHRFTRTDDGLWLEVWDEKPAKEAAFNPPYTVASPHQD